MPWGAGADKAQDVNLTIRSLGILVPTALVFTFCTSPFRPPSPALKHHRAIHLDSSPLHRRRMPRNGASK